MRCLHLLTPSLFFCMAAGQNDLDTIFEKTADWFKEYLPKNPPTLPPFITPSQPPFSLGSNPLFPTPSPLRNGFELGTLPTFPTPPPPQPIPTMDPRWMMNSFNGSALMAPVNFTVDPEALMTVPEIITHWGYPVEEYNVVTRDGYILTLHRIPYGRKGPSRKPRPVVLLQHGLLCTSSIWLLNLPSQSAGFVFADAGFDVWLGNMRGNTYSKTHYTMDAKESRFWRFSWEEMARYDLDAMVDGVLNVTQQEQLYYVGHSQGTLTMFAKLATDAVFARKIRKFFALAPVARLVNVKGMFHTIGEAYPQLKLFYEMIGDHEFLPNNMFTRLLTDMLCDKKMKNPICEDFIYQVSGPDSNQLNKTRIGIYLAHNPAGTSWRNLVHYAQMVKYGRMRPYDMGVEKSKMIYNMPHPPEFKLSNIDVPTYLFYSDSDWLATTEGVEGFILRQIDGKHIRLKRKLKDFNHNDFLWGQRAKEEIYDVIIEAVKYDHRRRRLKDGVQRYLKAKAGLNHNETHDSFLQSLLS